MQNQARSTNWDWAVDLLAPPAVVYTEYEVFRKDKKFREVPQRESPSSA